MTTAERLGLTVAWMVLAAWLVVRRTAVRSRRSQLSRAEATHDSPRHGGRPASRRVAAVVGLLAVVALGGAVPAAGLLALAFGVPRWRAARRQRGRADAAWARAPDVVTLVHLAVTSGLTPYLAVAEVAQFADEPFGHGLRAVLADVRAGQRLPDALARLIDDVGEAARPLVAALTTSERYGVPLLPALDAAAAELRRRRRQAAEARARRLPVLLSFPLVCCILPAFVCLSIAPIAVSALRSLPAPASTTRSSSSPGSPPAPPLPGGTP